jgi:hypothetical protein
MKDFTIEVNEDTRELINNLRKKFNPYLFRNSITSRYAKFMPSCGDNGIYGIGYVNTVEISTEEFLKFYNEKMGINQSINYEVW